MENEFKRLEYFKPAKVATRARQANSSRGGKARSGVNRMRFASVMLFAAAALVCGGSEASRAAPSAKSPEELIQNLVSAANRGAVEEFHANLSEGGRKVIENLHRMHAPRPPQEFGPDGVLHTSARSSVQAPEHPHAPSEGKGRITSRVSDENMKAVLGLLKSVEILDKKERPDGLIELHVKSAFQTPGGPVITEEDTLLARQETGEWKLEGRVPEPNRRQMFRSGVDRPNPVPASGSPGDAR